jgi:hypothetical protein
MIHALISTLASAIGQFHAESSGNVWNQQLLGLKVQYARYVVYSSLCVICSVLSSFVLIKAICAVFRYLYQGSFVFNLLYHFFISHHCAE